MFWNQTIQIYILRQRKYQPYYYYCTFLSVIDTW